MCFEIPRNLDVCELQRHILPRWPNFIVRAVRTAAACEFYYYSLDNSSARDLRFNWDIPQDMEKTKYP